MEHESIEVIRFKIQSLLLHPYVHRRLCAFIRRNGLFFFSFFFVILNSFLIDLQFFLINFPDKIDH